VSRALEEFMYRRALSRFEAIAEDGLVEDNWRELEELEMREARKQAKVRA
jgi:hypothetical protein